jgi:hypothetical protein
MAGLKTCPTPERLQELLAGQLSGEQQDQIAQHVESCAACQQSLERLSPASQSWENLAGHMQKPSPEPALQKVIDQAKGKPDAGQTEGDGRATPGRGGGQGEQTQAEARDAPPPGDLVFLAPSTKAGSLGRLGHYEVQSILGKGGFGIVLKAFDERLHRVVAIKVLAPAFAANGSARKRFIREARAAAAIKNEHVVGIYEVQEDANPPYLVMELIDGIALQDKLDRQGPLSLTEILRIGMQMAEGLVAAHKQGLVHRDIKPANILLENGVERVKITDFGLARAVDDASVTQSGTVAGTPMYMSPEQAEGLPIDHRSDLFSLGTVLYTMCTGHPPFRASGTHAVLRRVIDASPRPIREINNEIPDWLCDIIAKLHAKKQEDRFQTAAAVAELLGRHLAHLQQPGSAAMPAFTATPCRGEPPRTPQTGREKEAAFPVQLMPRDIVDLALILLLAPIVIGLFLVLPSLLFACLAAWTGLGDWSVLIGILGGLAVFFGLFFLLGLRAAQRAIVSQRGIELVRDAGLPTFIPWSRLQRIEEATRWEVFRRVWLWPGLPPRGSIMGLSALHHFRIEWDKGCYYFAPADPIAFRQAVIDYRAQAVEGPVEEAGLQGEPSDLNKRVEASASMSSTRSLPERGSHRRRVVTMVVGLVGIVALAWCLHPHLLLLITNSGRLWISGKDVGELQWELSRDGEVVKELKGLGFQGFDVEPGRYVLKAVNLKPGTTVHFDFNRSAILSGSAERKEADTLTFAVARGESVNIEVRRVFNKGTVVLGKPFFFDQIGLEKVVIKSAEMVDGKVRKEGEKVAELKHDVLKRRDTSQAMLAPGWYKVEVVCQPGYRATKLEIERNGQRSFVAGPNLSWWPLELKLGDEVTIQVALEKTAAEPGWVLGMTPAFVGTLAEPIKHGPLSDMTIEAYITPRPKDRNTLIPGRVFTFVPDGGPAVDVGDTYVRLSALGLKEAVNTRGIVMADEPVHVACVRQGKEMRLYFCGKLQGKEQLVGPMFTSPHAQFLLGSRGGSSFSGSISEIRISSSARYQGDFTPAARFEADKDTLALFHCDEGQGQKLIDSSGNNHHAKIVGARWVKEPGWLPLFNRKDLTGWVVDKAMWQVHDNGTLVYKGPKEAPLRTEKTFVDCVLRFEYQWMQQFPKTTAPFLDVSPRTPAEKAAPDPARTYPLVQVIPWGGTCGLNDFRNLPLAGFEDFKDKNYQAVGWNRVEIRCRAERLVVKANGLRVAELATGKAHSGNLVIAPHNAGIIFRNIEIQGAAD